MFRFSVVENETHCDFVKLREMIIRYTIHSHSTQMHKHIHRHTHRYIHCTHTHANTDLHVHVHVTQTCAGTHLHARTFRIKAVGNDKSTKNLCKILH